MEDRNDWRKKFQSCNYSDRLIDKLEQLNKNGSQINIDYIKKAIFYAKKYHGTQLRKSGELYYSHPLEVAYMVSDYLPKTDVIITSILHDIIEDTKLTKEMIANIFGELIANQVEDLTRIKIDRKISSAEMVESLWIQKKYDVLLVKQFDRLHNIQTIGAMSPEKTKKIVGETLQTFLLLAICLEIPLVKQELVKLCYQNLGVTEPLPTSYQIMFDDGSQLLPLIFQNDIDQIQSLYLLVS